MTEVVLWGFISMSATYWLTKQMIPVLILAVPLPAVRPSGRGAEAPYTLNTDARRHRHLSLLHDRLLLHDGTADAGRFFAGFERGWISDGCRHAAVRNRSEGRCDRCICQSSPCTTPCGCL